MLINKLYRLTWLLMLTTSGIALGQAAQSPYTSRGIGDIYDFSLAHNQGMGGVGLSNGSYWHLNNMNPALLPYNTLTVFSAGFIGASRTVKNEDVSETNTGGNLNYLATAFPIKPGKWTSSVGLTPYSNVDYNFTYITTVEGSNDRVAITESGEGGYNQVYWSNGVAINRHFFIGLKAAYLFSSVTSTYSNQLVDLGSYIPEVKERVSVSDFMFRGGLAFNKDSVFNSPVRLNIGVTYNFATEIDAKKLQTFERRSGNLPNPISSDTIQFNKDGSLYIPEALGFGLSLNRGQRWSAGIDFTYQKWAEFKNFERSNTDMDNSFKIALGGEFTPDPSSVTSYLKRVTYRIGGSFEQTPYLIDNGSAKNQVKDFGINFGWSLPVSRFSSLDMAFRLGRRGNINDTLLEEDYYKIYLGITFNDQWFIKRKYD